MLRNINRVFNISHSKLYSQVLPPEQAQVNDVDVSDADIKKTQDLFNQFNQSKQKISNTTNDKRVVAFCTSIRPNLTDIKINLKNISMELRPAVYQQKRKKKDQAFLHLRISEKLNDVPSHLLESMSFLSFQDTVKDIFWFEDGVVVGWGLNDKDQRSLENLHGQHFDANTSLKEDMTFEFGNKCAIDLERDTLILSDSGDDVLEKITFSYGLARSLKLEEIESDVEKAVSKALEILKFGSEGKSAKVTKSECRAELARLYHLRYNLTVRSRLLDSPGFLWDKPNSYQDLFDSINTYLDIPDRIDIVQQKLHLPESYWQLENDHGSSLIGWRLEKVIIVLIFVEILFEVFAKSSNWKVFTWEKLVGLEGPDENLVEE